MACCKSWAIAVARLGVVFTIFVISAMVAPSQDFQNWNEVDLTASWKRIDLLLPVVVRTDTHLPNPQFVATGAVAFISVTQHLLLAGGYLFADLPQSGQVAHVPLVAITPIERKGRFTLMDQNRFEKLVDYKTEPVRYRDLALIDRRFGSHDAWHAFADDEIFFNLSTESWNQNRFQVGGGMRLNSRLSLDVYYLQRNASGGAAPSHILGTILTVKLSRAHR
jgi:hypothetical protein